MDFCNLFLFTWVIATTYALGYEGIDDGYDRYEHDEGYNEGYESNPAHYQYEYGVADPYTGDYHQQQEIREGEIVKGSYSLKEPDGSTRIVEYYAGPHTGFNAIVKKVGPSYHPYPYYAQGGIGYAQGYGGYDISHYGLGKGIGYGYGYESPYGHVGVRYGY